MLEAFLWGLVAASSLVVGEILAVSFKIPRRLLGLIMAFGVGVLISAVSFDLVEDAFRSTHSGWGVAVGLIGGALVFFIGDELIDRMGGRAHRLPGAKPKGGSGSAILLGTILDGIPESIVIGMTLVRGGSVGIAMLVAVFLSNLPEAIGATTGLRAGGWSRLRTLTLWIIVAVISAFASLLGYAFFDKVGPDIQAFTLAFAAGALLTMLADSMMPEAYRDSGKWVGLVTTLGFGLAYLIDIIS